MVCEYNSSADGPVLLPAASQPQIKDRTLSDTFLERLRQNTLTDSDQYRKIKKSAVTADEPLCAPVTEDWKKWDLMPVTSGPYSAYKQEQPHGDESVKSVQRALTRLG